MQTTHLSGDHRRPFPEQSRKRIHRCKRQRVMSAHSHFGTVPRRAGDGHRPFLDLSGSGVTPAVPRIDHRTLGAAGGSLGEQGFKKPLVSVLKHPERRRNCRLNERKPVSGTPLAAVRLGCPVERPNSCLNHRNEGVSCQLPATANHAAVVTTVINVTENKCR